jgi:hypothetical protein
VKRYNKFVQVGCRSEALHDGVDRKAVSTRYQWTFFAKFLPGAALRAAARADAAEMRLGTEGTRV